MGGYRYTPKENEWIIEMVRKYKGQLGQRIASELIMEHRAHSGFPIRTDQAIVEWYNKTLAYYGNALFNEQEQKEKQPDRNKELRVALDNVITSLLLLTEEVETLSKLIGKED